MLGAGQREAGGHCAQDEELGKKYSELKDAGETLENQVQEWNLPYHFFSMPYCKERSNFLSSFVFLSEVSVCNPWFVKPV